MFLRIVLKAAEQGRESPSLCPCSRADREPGKGEGRPSIQLTKTAVQELDSPSRVREVKATKRDRGGGGGAGRTDGDRKASRTSSSHMGCVLSSDWCGEGVVQPVPVVRSSSLHRRSLERSESGRMRLTKVSVRSSP